MDYTDLLEFVNASSADTELVQTCWVQAQLLVNDFVGSQTVPSDIRERCYLACGSELFHARNAPNGISQYADMNGAPIRIARDPMTPVYSLLSAYVVMNL